MAEQNAYPVTFSVDYPDRELNKVTTFFRLIMVIPIGIILNLVAGNTWNWDFTGDEGSFVFVYTTVGLLFLPPLIMILARQKYPRWWFDWNLELQRFENRVTAYVALLDDTYPSTDEEQSVHLQYDYPDVPNDLNRWLPLVKWFLAIPHYVILFFLGIAAFVAVVIAWFAILFTGRYPKGLFDFVEGVMRWSNRVVGYAFTLVTDKYPPFSLN